MLPCLVVCHRRTILLLSIAAHWKGQQINLQKQCLTYLKGKGFLSFHGSWTNRHTKNYCSLGKENQHHFFFFFLVMKFLILLQKTCVTTEKLLKVCFHKKGFNMQKLCVSMTNTAILGFQRVEFQAEMRCGIPHHMLSLRGTQLNKTNHSLGTQIRNHNPENVLITCNLSREAHIPPRYFSFWWQHSLGDALLN